MKTLFTYLAIGCTVFAFSQNSTGTSIDLGRPPDCSGFQGICSFQSGNKNSSNASIEYLSKTGELILYINKEEVTLDQLEKLTRNSVSKDIYRYTLDQDFMLPPDIISSLQLPVNTFIKTGDYLVKNTKDFLVITFKTAQL